MKAKTLELVREINSELDILATANELNATQMKSLLHIREFISQIVRVETPQGSSSAPTAKAIYK